MPPGVLKLARTLLKDPAMVSIALSKPAEGVSQGAFLVDDRQKLPLMVELLKDKIGQRILIFGSTKIAVSALFKQLRSKGMNVGQISSDLEQAEREQVMMDFRNRKVDILVATDVVSRGIDVDGIDMVVNYDVPRDAEDYVHRIGRTARAARKGAALTLISPLDQVKFKRIEALIGSIVEKLPLPVGLQSDKRHAPPHGRRESSGSHSSGPRDQGKRPQSRDRRHSKGRPGPESGKKPNQ